MNTLSSFHRSLRYTPSHYTPSHYTPDHSSCNGDTACENRALVIGLSICGVILVVFIAWYAKRLYRRWNMEQAPVLAGPVVFVPKARAAAPEEIAVTVPVAASSVSARVG